MESRRFIKSAVISGLAVHSFARAWSKPAAHGWAHRRMVKK